MVQAISKYHFFSTVNRKNAYYQIPINAREQPLKLAEDFTSSNAFHLELRMRIMDNILKAEKLKDGFVYVDNVTICGMNQEEHDKNLNRFGEVAEKYNETLNKDKCEFTKTQIKLLRCIIEQGTLKPDPKIFRPLQHFPFQEIKHHFEEFSEKIHALTRCTKFLFPQPAVDAFKALTKNIVNSVVTAIDDELPFTVETDASDHAIDATLIKLRKPVAFFSRMLSYSEQRHSFVEKDAYDIIYRSGDLNTKADALSRICGSMQVENVTLQTLHNNL
ncbi:Retrovirus-related Pol polyprotein from transposon 17.6 [Trichinella nativa]|uniref:Retrovirus-related Pol polyprotein from transposon 17.6 n=1 Tax=Trichinella nativa TaxID=6335 RepID=A0A0V1LGA4_9BILA|nr:Retrovirus-related Pol polyprotein from transposon 17.6 [Trichinella nativa]